MQVGVLTGRIGYICRKPIAGMAEGGYGDRYTVEGYSPLAPFDGLEQGGGQRKTLAQQVLYRGAILLSGDNVCKDSHKVEPPGVDFLDQL